MRNKAIKRSLFVMVWLISLMIFNTSIHAATKIDLGNGSSVERELSDEEDEDDLIIIDSGMCGENVAYVCYTFKYDPTIYLDCFVIPIPGDCCIFSYKSSNDPPWAGYRSTVNVVSVSGVIELGKYGFYGFTGCNKFSFDSSLKVIGPYAMAKCNSISTFSVPDSVVLIGKCAFFKDKGLSSIVLGSSVEYVGSYAFSKCSLKSVKLNDKLKEIGKYAFAYNKNLESVKFGKSDLVIKDFAFAKCVSLGKVIVPKWVSCKNNVFRGCN